MTIYVNGKRFDIMSVEPDATLLEFLRSPVVSLTGTKLGCGEVSCVVFLRMPSCQQRVTRLGFFGFQGGCGACTVMVSQVLRGKIVHRAVNACLAPLASVDSCAVTTVEGIGTVKGGMHPVQERIARLHGSQCGFCTPGIVMALYTVLRNNPSPTRAEIEEAMDGNLCRCTGYRPILDAAKSFASDKEGCCASRSDGSCCRDRSFEKEWADKQPPTNERVFRVVTSTVSKATGTICAAPYSGDAEPIFPPYLQTKHEIKPLRLEGERVLWFRPTSLEQLLEIKGMAPDAKLIVGNTEVGIETKFKGMPYPIRVHVSHVPELQEIEIVESEDGPKGVHIGGCVSLTDLETVCRDMLRERPQQAGVFGAIKSMLRWFASNQIRNVAALAGNIATASPISDLNPTLVSSGAMVTLVEPSGAQRTVPMTSFFKSYRKTEMRPGEVILRVFLPFTRPFEFIHAFKQARRREDDIALAGASFRVLLEPNSAGSWTVAEAGMGFAGMAPITAQAPTAVGALVGAQWDDSVIGPVVDALLKDLPLPHDVPGGMPEYRRTLAASFFLKFFLRVNVELASAIEAAGGSLPAAPSVHDRDTTAAFEFERELSHGLQAYDVPRGVPHAADAAGRPGGSGGAASSAAGGAGDGSDTAAKTVPAAEEGGARSAAVLGNAEKHQSSLLQVTGEALYTDDMPLPGKALESWFVTSTHAHAKLLSVDTSAALEEHGVVAVLTHEDIREGANVFGGGGVMDEEIFPTTHVYYVGQPIAIVVATTRGTAERAAKLVKVEYEELPAITSIEDAIAANSFQCENHGVLNGDVEAAFSRDDVVVVEGSVRCGGQEHFYLESNATVAIPGESGTSMQIYCSTQAAHKTQMCAAKMLGMPASRVVCHVKRMGGGFGGKETRTVPLSLPVVLAASKLGRPVRMNVDRNIDMMVTGQRHAFLGEYKVAVTAEGKFVGLEAQLYAEGGFSSDLSQPVTDRAVFHVDNAYDFGATKISGRVCKTHLPSRTAFRGFGGPQGMFVCEDLIERVASRLGKPAHEIRRLNLYNEGALTPYLQPITHYHVPRMWDSLMETSDFARRAETVAAFNTANRYRKRGLAIVPTKYGINFTAKFFNQGGALVHIYVDGTVLVSHGGTEMGQGLHTKVLQVVAHTLGVPLSACYIDETSTDKVPNASPTAASASSDLYGAAAFDACRQLNERLAPYVEKMPDATFAQRVNAAYFDRVNLSAQGFFATPVCGYDWSIADYTKRGTPFAYFTQGVAVAEVDVDTLTGDFHVLRADILMDLGNSLNPAIDIGQIEGAFVQGMGWLTLEEAVWGDKAHKWVRPGHMFTQGPGTYKIPSFNDVPLDFRVALLHDEPNPAAIYSSKAVGEPPYFMASAVFLAIRNAISAARLENGIEGHFELDAPATAERIRMACGGPIAAKTVADGNIKDFAARGSF